MLHYVMDGEAVSAKELRQIAEEYIGAVAWHIPLQAVVAELNRKGFRVTQVITVGM